MPTIVFIWLQDLFGNDIDTNAFFSVHSHVFDNQSSSPFNNQGYAELSVIDSEDSGNNYEFSISFPDGVNTKQIFFNPVLVPNLGAVSLTSLTQVKGSL